MSGLEASAETPVLGRPEFSRLVGAEAIAADERVHTLVAGAAERQALARRFGLVVIHRLEAAVGVRRLDGGRLIRVQGSVSADVVQSCVVTLEPVPATVNEDFGALFTQEPRTESRIRDTEPELILDPDAIDEDLPEPMVGGAIDIGELVAQHLSLALDPYPRAAGVVFGGLDDDRARQGAGRASPFEALAVLKRST